MRNQKQIACTLLYLFASCGSVAVADTDVDFNRDIRPILSDRCFACHGPDDEANDSGYRLDLADQAVDELPSGDGFAIVPGDPSTSELLQRILSDDESMVMPPPESNLTVNKDEIELIRNWIAGGGKYAQHWSFVPPVKAALPKVAVDAWKVSPIDQFVFDRLASENLSPSSAADRYTLIRRLTLDLTGLPPSADEVTAFVHGDSPDAYEQLVQRLLESPHFGERMALDWLDAARYADTNGFSIDGGRHMWLWRDWVINAFNSNKPYNEFLIEQIAGDVMPNATPAQLIASGFQRNNMVTHEGGTIPLENLTNYNADRVKTLGEAVLGLTLGCCQCHDHKYDPITQKDYYSLFAYFNTLSDKGLDGNAGVNPAPYKQAKTVLQTGRERQLQQRIEKIKGRLAKPKETTLDAWEKSEQRKLKRRGKRMSLQPVKVEMISTPNRGAGFEIEQDRFVHITQPSGLAAYDVLSKLPESDAPITGLRFVFHPDPGAPAGGWGYGPKNKVAAKGKDESPVKGNFVLTALSVSVGTVPADQVDLFRLLKSSAVTANAWQSDHRPADCLDMRNLNGWSPPVDHDGPVHLTFTFDEPIDSSQTPYLTTQLNFGSGENLIAAKFEILAMTGVDDDSDLTPEVISAFGVPKPQRSAEQTQTLVDFFAAHARQSQRLRTDLANVQERIDVLTGQFPTMVMDVAEKPRETFILMRGDYSKPTDAVSMDTPDFLPKTETQQDGRLALANWVTMPSHPLTSRVYVNRIWQMMFGAGIVRTPADFGSQGAWPTHPKLLDWLAVDFVDSGWDIKAMVKRIVMSETYRQSSVTSKELLRRDPENLLLARGPRFRLFAEAVRDSALATSGLLRPYLGGPSVNPYAPGDLWREVSHYGSSPATAQTFVQDHGEKLYRRSLYTFWKRTSPPPNMAAFDAPNRETCVVNRPITNTPLQALVMLNDVQFVEAARAFAQRIITQDPDDQNRLQWAILESLSRPAFQSEMNTLGQALERELRRYQADPTAAQALVSIGESLRDRTIPIEELAAWTQIASTILNLSETVTRN